MVLSSYKWPHLCLVMVPDQGLNQSQGEFIGTNSVSAALSLNTSTCDFQHGIQGKGVMQTGTFTYLHSTAKLGKNTPGGWVRRNCFSSAGSETVTVTQRQPTLQAAGGL